MQRAADRVRARGLEPVFHHHLGTDVETPDEIRRLLDLTDVSLCLDTAHLWLAGGDPVEALREWGPCTTTPAAPNSPSPPPIS
ncbi:sugar phosphate isomerase/epimerase family protein [Streptomyces sp. NPDC051684]|uniref:sugar phosphate isomerase/epimerase family protein n=1 Tax=Streptomyces sp. NPDC051684 TaxID=3365670 RepID=UPI003795395B